MGNSKTLTLAKVAGWNSKDISLFNKFLADYDSIPNYKKLLSSMIKFESMYQPIIKGSLVVDKFGDIARANEARRIKKMGPNVDHNFI